MSNPTPSPIYLDHHATTPCDPRVVEAMLPWFGPMAGNAGSTKHLFGKNAAAAVQRARIQVASLIGASPKDIIFTSGATEAINLALKGLAEMHPQRRQLVTVATEHRAVLDVATALGRRGVETTIIPVDGNGRVDVGHIERAIDPERTLAVAVMAANNEVGTIHPFAEIGELCSDRGVYYLCDATQAAGILPLHIRRDHIHMAALSAHKMYGPLGVGALVARQRDPRIRLRTQSHGGSQERGLRSGTLNVPGIVGFGTACAIVEAERDTFVPEMERRRDSLLRQLNAGVPDLRLNGLLQARLPHNLNVSLPGLPGAQLLDALRPHIAVSSGSACSTDSNEPSHVLKAMGLSDALAYSSLRFGIGRQTTDDDIATAAGAVIRAATALRR